MTQTHQSIALGRLEREFCSLLNCPPAELRLLKLYQVTQDRLYRSGISDITALSIIGYTWLECQNAIQKNQTIKEPHAWLRVVADRQISAHFKKRIKDKNRLTFDSLLIDSFLLELTSEEYSTDPLDQFNLKDPIVQLQRAMAKLEDKDIRIIQLVVIDKLSAEKVVTILLDEGFGLLTPDNVRQRKKRALEKLRKLLSE
jgi:DNA-directed RNA polymerase specialized sigma24 family protein